MKVKDLAKKIRLINTEVILKEYGREIGRFKSGFESNEYYERTINSFEPTNKNEIVIHLKAERK